jgi:hypothetical protein
VGFGKNSLTSIGLELLEIKVGLDALPESKHIEFERDNPGSHRCWDARHTSSALNSTHALGVHALMHGAWARVTCSSPCS